MYSFSTKFASAAYAYNDSVDNIVSAKNSNVDTNTMFSSSVELTTKN